MKAYICMELYPNKTGMQPAIFNLGTMILFLLQVILLLGKMSVK
jgi:hypothetical protein